MNTDLINPKYSGDKILDLFSKYAKNRNKQIFRLLEKDLLANHPHAKKILELGAGKGEFINRFKSMIVKIN